MKAENQRNLRALFTFALLGMFTCVSAVSAQTINKRAGGVAPTFVRLTETDVKIAGQVLKSVNGGHQEQILEIVERSHMSLDRLEGVLSTIYVLLVQLNVEDVEAHKGSSSDSAEVKEWLKVTKNKINSYINQYFGSRKSDYAAARKLVMAYKAELLPFLPLLYCQGR